jgi:uncharacterized protein (TIGR03437 family)
MNFDPAVFGTISAVAVFSAQGDAMGIATISGQSLDVSISSAAGGIGQLPRLPVLTVTIPVLATAPAGTVSAITLDASQTRWTDAQNNAYSVTVAPGSVTVGGSLSVHNLAPGGGLLPAGTLVRINGTGFSAATTTTIDEVAISNTQFAGPGEIDLTLGGAADLTGKRVVLRNPDGSQLEYFPAIPSVPDLAPAYAPSIQPLLSMQTWTSAAVTFTMRGGAIALQNSNPTAVDVILQMRNPVATQIGQTTVTIPPGALNVYATSGGGDGFRAFAALPVRMLGMGYPFPQPGQPGLYLVAPGPTVPPLQQLTAAPAAVSFQWQTGTAAPAPVDVSLYSMQIHSNFTFRVASPAAPFSATLTATTAPAILTVAVNPIGLSPGTYTGHIILTPEGPNLAVTTIPLSLTVGTAALLAVDFQSLTFSGPDNDWQSLTVASNGNPVAFTMAASDSSGPHWLSVTPSAATTPAQLTITANSTNLGEGVYNGQIVITGSNNAVTVPVQLTVSASYIYNISPASVTFSVPAGSAPPPPQTVIVAGAGSVAAFSASTSSGGPWLSVSPAPSGQLAAVIAANPAGLKAGTYSGTVTLTSPASPLPATIPVTLVIWDKEPALTVTPLSVTFIVPLENEYLESQPLPLQVTSGGVPLNFTVSGKAGSPAAFTTPASIPVYPDGLGGALGADQYDIAISGGTQKIVVPVTTIGTTSPLAPPFMGAVVNAASQFPGPVSPGEILSIYGFGVGPSNTAGFTLDPSGKVATLLNGAQVLFDGRPAPMIYGSAPQANVIVPYEVDGQATTTIALQFAGVTSAAWAIPVAASAPGIFTLASSGIGPAAVLNQDNSVNSASNPAARGTIIQIYATGEGETSPHGVTGSVIGTGLKTPVLGVKVTIGGQDAVVQYAGSAGASVAGLLQVNAVVPQAVAPGAAVPIAISVGGVPSPSGVTIAVQ